MNTEAGDVPTAQDTVENASVGAVRYEIDGRVAHIVLNRPSKMNAIGRSVLGGIREAVFCAESDPAVKVIIVRGEGRAFSAGGDLDEVSALVRDSPEFDRFLDYWHETLILLERCPLPTIAAVHGVAFAGGFEVTQACDFVVMGDETKIGDQHANFGLFPAGGSTQRLPRLVGPRTAKWMLMTGAAIGPATALASGLVNEVVPEADVLARAKVMAAVLAGKSMSASAAIKAAVSIGADLPLRDAIDAERQIALRHMASEDVQTGLAAFRSRATPEFD
ncbi:enoyl-CoA hydratase (plasmid) [Rhodococcus jostii RHA1]|uniref:Enoyl-CoA hydratase n=1 Tax=Rhodococcus jostii (strain RHA1) TaxID=101510 RepID=Q0RV57_RHOJR|nr:enoyl-CoA hydratase/isomerase family protein [Rhodococcus jostii]ABH00829.1 enoyl-CoA hydratase [Rhodococcus jostii RHA1]